MKKALSFTYCPISVSRNYPHVIFDFYLGILIEKTESRIILRSPPPSFQSGYIRKDLKLHLENFSKQLGKTMHDAKYHLIPLYFASIIM